MPTYLYSRIPAAAVFTSIDGNAYAYIPHSLDGRELRIIEANDSPRMVRFGADSFIRGGEAFVLFGKLGDALPVPSVLPFGVTAERRDAEGRINEHVATLPARVNGLTYCGWTLSYSAARPVTGQWRAERFGVGICAGTRDALIRMIDTRPRT